MCPTVNHSTATFTDRRSCAMQYRYIRLIFLQTFAISQRIDTAVDHVEDMPN